MFNGQKTRGRSAERPHRLMNSDKIAEKRHMENQNVRILVVDDEKAITLLLSRILKEAGYEVQTTTNPAEAVSKAEYFSPNVIISDLKMPGMTGIELMKEVRTHHPEIDFIILTAFGTVENAVQAMKEGARDYLIKPLRDPDELRMAVARTVERQALLDTNSLWKRQLADELPPTDIIFAGMDHIWEQIQNVAPTGATILLEGESGTGKSLIAKVIHELSGKKGPFVALNCAAIPETLIESELFGHEKGAFTGAVRTKKGKFELAHEGTIFLDEIGEMPLAAQTKLLRILQERTFERVGGTTTLTTGARIVAATNQDLKARIKEKIFREDLFYRLNVFPITLPPLRERRNAIPVLGKYLMESVSKTVGRPARTLPEESWNILSAYDWPGNVRELHNILERSAILDMDPVELISRGAPDGKTGDNLPAGKMKSLKDIEKEAIEKTLKETKGHRRKAAEILGISLRSLQYKIKEYGIVRR